MKNKIFIFCSFASLACTSLTALKNEPLFSAKRAEQMIYINNRILARVNGKSISTYDLMKKLDLTFYRQYPQFASSPEARFQFYELSWKPALSEMIDKELILADANESKITVSSGDVRQEIESSFGPNIIANLDKAGISYDEAAKFMQEEIIIRRLISGRVHAKALRQVTPNKIKAAYEAFVQDPSNTRNTQWSYRVITIKERNLERTNIAAKEAHQLLTEGVSLENLSSQLKEKRILGRKGSIAVSNTIKHTDKEVAQDFRKVLSTLEKGSFSEPFSQKSRSNNASVYRILVMEDIVPGGTPSYKEMEASLKEKLLDKEIDTETDLYLLKLRQHYHIRQQDLDALLPEGYQPFILK